MATTDDNKKKPLVTLDAANPVEPTPTVQELAKSDNQVGVGWGKDNDDLPTLTQQQLENIQKAPDGVSMNDINKAPGTSTTPKPNKSTTNYGVLAGAPSQVVIQHMLDQLPPMETKEQREKRERRERINKTMAALGDGFSSLANIYYATKGAPAAEGKTLSAGETERQDKEKKDRENAIERRIRLLKEQWADHDRLERMRLAKELNDARVQWYGTQGKAKLQDANTNMTTKTIEANAKKGYYETKGKNETDDTQNKITNRDSRTQHQNTKDDKTGSAAVTNAASNKKRADAYGSRVANQNYNDNRNTTDKINKRKDGNANNSTTKKKTNVTWK